MSTPFSLTHNAVLYISLGFRQSYILQVLIKDAKEDCLLLTLYDGMVIIGGRFPFAPNDPLVTKLKNLDVIKLECQFVTLKDPILIKNFTIVNDEVTSPLGKDFLHLERFLQRQQLFQCLESKEEKKKIQQQPQIDLQVEEPKSNASKRRKENEVQSAVPVLSGSNPKEKPATCLVPNQVAKYVQKVQDVIDLDSGHFITETQVIRVKSLPKSNQSEESASTQRSTNIHQNISRPPLRDDIQYVSELYERIQRFKIVCRVNYIANIFTRKGKPATLFMLIDAKGGEIMAKVYESSIEGNIQRQNRIKPQIQLAKTYSFENGEIEKNKDNLLTATFSWHQINPIVAFIASFNISRVLTVEGICKLSAEETVARGIDLSGSQERVSSTKAKQFAVCGIFCGLNSPPKVINSTYFKAIGTLADPEAKKQVNFSIFIHQREGLPKEGSVLILHHMRVLADQRTRKLISSNNSYFVNESYNANPYFKGFSKWIDNAEWKSQVYQNVSEVDYVSRTIQDLLSILPHLEQMECCYSQIQCRVESLKDKKSYDACSVCNSQLYSNKHTHAYCRTCRQTNLAYKRFIFDLVVVDERGTLEIDLPSDKAGSEMHMGKDYLQLPIKDRQEYLQLCKFTPLVLRIESEQQIGGTSHRVISAQKQTMQRVMASIRRETVKERLEKRDSWQ